MEYFFRHQPDTFVFPMYSMLHLLILGIAALGVWLIIVNRQALRASNKLRISLAIGLIVVQLALYAWFASGDAALRAAGLPLYHCRVAEIAMVVALLSRHRFAKTIALYLGSYGSFFALLIPIMEAYRFPHVTNIAYFAAHLLMIWTVTYLLFVERYQFERASLQHVLIFLNLLNIVIVLVNPLLNMNYAYFAHSPIFTNTFQSLPRDAYLALLFLVYNLLILMIYCCGKTLSTKSHTTPK